MQVLDLGTMKYRDAWAIQEKIHADVQAGSEEHLLLVEHPPVITFGRRGETEGQKNLLASTEYLAKLGVEIVQSDRGGDVTFHGPGQVVAYPIIRLNDHALSVGGYVHKLEAIVIATLKQIGVDAFKDEAGIGVWVKERAEGRGQRAEENASDNSALCPHPSALAKICAIGVRIRGGTSLHGIALNVETKLKYFDLIVPCGLAGKHATSLRKILGEATPTIESVKKILAAQFAENFASAQAGPSGPGTRT